MKQVIQNYRTGDLELAEVPVPNCSSNMILVKNEASLVSLGLLTIQILKAYGCNVIGYDIDQAKVNLAKKMQIDGAFIDIDELKHYVDKSSSGYGMDAVIITASTKNDEPVNTAVEISRMKGRIVMVGVGDIYPDRNEMWHKEVDIVVSKQVF